MRNDAERRYNSKGAIRGSAATTQGLREGLMKIWRAMIVALPGLLAAGCKSDVSRDLLERDNFNKEQQIYQLKCRVEDLEAQLNSAAASPLPPPMTRPAAPAELEAAPTFTRPAPAAAAPPRSNEGPTLPDSGPLRISPGTETAPGEVPGIFRAPPGSEPGRIPPQGNMYYWQPARANVQLASGALPADDNRVVWQITLHPSLTGGIGNGASGDQGLLVVVEPRDQAGNILLAPGQTSVALIDPALTGEQARLARWDFSAADTERALHRGAEPGIHLRLPWRYVPSHDRLKVFVRYNTRDGRKLQAEQTIAVALGDDEAAFAVRADAGERAAGPWPPEPARDVPGPRRPSDPHDAIQRPQWLPDRD